MRRLSMSLLLCLVLIAAVFPAQAQQVNFKDVDSVVTDLMKLYNVPGVALAVVQDGKVTYTKGYGVRSTETNAPVTEGTLFGIGSVTKSFTALDVMQLVEQGKLDLDMPIIKYLPDFKLSDPEATKTLTLRHLMSHTSGLPRSESWLFSKTPLTRKQVIDGMANINLSAQPGKLWQYNNQNFLLAGYIAETISGLSWEDYTQKYVFDPLGMKTANFDSAVSQKTADYAVGHALDMLKGMVPIPFSTKLGAIAPAGAINASVRDMAQYALFQLGNGSVNGQQIVSEKNLTTMHTQQIAIGGADSAATPAATKSAAMAATTAATTVATAQVTPAATMIATQSASETPFVTSYGYGLAWFTETYREMPVVEHGGNIDGFSANVLLAPSAKTGIVVLTNQDISLFPQVASWKLLEVVLGLKPGDDVIARYNKAVGFDPQTLQSHLDAARAFKPEPAELNKYVGDYTSPIGKFNVSVRGNGLVLTLDGPDQSGEIELVQFEPGKFLGNSGQTRGMLFTFKTDDQGTITVYQTIGGQDINIAERRAQGVKTADFKDPNGLFTVAVPEGLTVQATQGLAIIQSPDPRGVFILTGFPANGTDLQATTLKFIQNFDKTFDQKPDETSGVKAASGTWTEFRYKLPSDQLLVVAVTQQQNTVYIVMLQAKTADAQKLMPTFTGLLETMKLTAK